MKGKLFISAILVIGFAEHAAAGCNDPRVQQPRQTLAGNTVCGERGSGASLERWQEEHQGSGNGASPLWDYKRGDGHPIDPRKQVGTWEATQGANAVVTYAYTNGPTYVYSLHDAGGGRYSFCSGAAEIVNARVQSGIGAACTSF